MGWAMHIVCPQCDAINRVPDDKPAAAGRCGKCREMLFDGRPAALDTARFARHLEQSGIPLLVDFWASWCGPCRIMAPEFERAAALLEPAVRLVKIDVDAEPDLAARFHVQSIPCLVLAFRGRELARAAGARSAAQLVGWVRGELARAPTA